MSEKNKFDYPSNTLNSGKTVSSLKSKEDLPKKEIKKVVGGKVIIKKKSLLKTFSEVFFGENIKTTAQYVLYDVLVPSAKKLFVDTIQDGVDMWVFGEARSSKLRRDRNRTIVNYSSLSDSHRRGASSRVEHSSVSYRSRHSFNEILIPTRAMAEEVLTNLLELIDIYGFATVADLYNMLDVTTEFTDGSFGWENLSEARVVPVRDGYILELPRPVKM